MRDAGLVNEEILAFGWSALMTYDRADPVGSVEEATLVRIGCPGVGVPMPRGFIAGRALTNPLSLRAQLSRGELVARTF